MRQFYRGASCPRAGRAPLRQMARDSGRRHGDEARLRGDAFEPGADRRERREIEPALRTVVRVRVQADVRDRVALADEKAMLGEVIVHEDRKSTRLNCSHLGISYAVFCLKKKNKI